MNAPTLKTLALIIATLPYAALAENTATPRPEQTAELQTVNVTGKNRSTRTENRDSYTTSAMRTTTGLALSPKETPQSVSVITKTQLDNQGMTNMEQALKTTTGINVIPDSGRWRYQSRGFYIDQIEEDGLSTTVAGSSGNPYNDPQSMSNLAIYDHIEVVRGPTGLTQSNSEPGGTINAVRKRPTANTQATLSFMADRFGAADLIGDVSGSLNSSHSVRGRLVSSLTRNKTFQDKNPTKGQMLYGILETDIGENSKATLGGLYQRTEETPDFYGVPMGNGFDLNLPRDTYLGAEWNQIRLYKRNVFAEFDHQINDNWKWSSKLNYNRSSSAQNFATAANTGGRFAGIGQNGIFTGATDNIQKYDNTGKQFAFQTGVSGKFQALGNEQQAFANYIIHGKTTAPTTYGKPVPLTNTIFSITTGRAWRAPIGQAATPTIPIPNAPSPTMPYRQAYSLPLGTNSTFWAHCVTHTGHTTSTTAKQANCPNTENPALSLTWALHSMSTKTTASMPTTPKSKNRRPTAIWTTTS